MAVNSRYQINKHKTVYLKILIVLINILNGIIAQGIIRSGNSNQKTQLLAFVLPLVLYFVGGIIIIIVWIIVALCHHQNVEEQVEENKLKPPDWILLICKPISIFIGSIAYYFGDNFTRLARNLHWNVKQLKNVETGTSIALIIAVVCYRLIPLCLERILEARGKKEIDIEFRQEKFKPLLAAVSMIALVADFDSVFTLADSFMDCSLPVTTGFLAALLVFSWISYGITLIVSFYYSVKKNSNKDGIQILIGVIVSIMLWVCFGLYLLADNKLPVYCACTFKGKPKQFAILRLTFLGFVGYIYWVLFILLIIFDCVSYYTYIKQQQQQQQQQQPQQQQQQQQPQPQQQHQDTVITVMPREQQFQTKATPDQPPSPRLSQPPTTRPSLPPPPTQPHNSIEMEALDTKRK